MTLIEIIELSLVKAAAVKAAAKILKEKYPDLLEDEPEINNFVKLLIE